MSQPLISIVTPVYNEEQSLSNFFDRMLSVLNSYRYELILIDDGSSDRSWSVIQNYSKKNKNIHALRLARNFGHQAAITAGLEHAKGDAVITIDSDLQDPPEVIPQMIKKWNEGYDVVYGVRANRKGETFFKKATASLFYRILKSSSKIDVPVDAGDFRLMSRKVVDILNQIPERIRFVRGLTSWVGFNQTGVPYERDGRAAGTSKYSLFRMLRLAFDGLTSFSSIPLRLASLLGLIVTGISFLVAIHAIYVRFFNDATVRGWTSILIVVIFLGGVQLIMIGIVGEYIGRIYQEVKRRPVYLLSEKIGYANGDEKSQ